VVAAAVMMLAVPSVAAAENFYAAIRGGPGWTQETESGFAGFEDHETYKLGFTGGGALGYMFPFGLRVEGEFGYLYAPLDTDGGVEVSGSVKSYLLMANAYYDLRLTSLGPFRPYVGFGLGGARVNYDHEFFNEAAGVKVSVDEWRTAFAYQARAGVIYDVNRWLDLSLGYRYLHIDGGQIDGRSRTVTLGPINNHSVEFGFAIKF
jgi:opacity protein-like surface antigen